LFLSLLEYKLLFRPSFRRRLKKKIQNIINFLLLLRSNCNVNFIFIIDMVLSYWIKMKNFRTEISLAINYTISYLEILIYISVDILFIVSHLCFTYVKIEKENWTLIVCCKEDHPHTHIAEWKNRCKTNKQKGSKGRDMCKIYRSGIRKKKRIVLNNWTKKNCIYI